MKICRVGSNHILRDVSLATFTEPDIQHDERYLWMNAQDVHVDQYTQAMFDIEQYRIRRNGTKTETGKSDRFKPESTVVVPLYRWSRKRNFS